MDAVDFAVKYGRRPRKVSEIFIDFTKGTGEIALGVNKDMVKSSDELFNPVEVAVCLREFADALEEAQKEEEEQEYGMYMDYADYDEGRIRGIGWEEKF